MNKAAIFEDLKRVIAERGGTCLTKMYSQDSIRVHIRCAKGHEWFTKASNIRHQGTWCPTCQYNTLRVNKLTKEQCEQRLIKLQETAKEKRGRCLSTEYVNEATKVEMECEYGHRWLARAYPIIHGQWCKLCSPISSINEETSRLYFEQLFDKEFPSSRPQWLVGPKGGKLELDGYCKELKLAFEYQGEQHYAPVPHYGGESKLKTRRQYDQLKRDLCKANGVALIEIRFDEANIREYILRECGSLGINVPNRDKEIKIEKEGIYNRFAHLLKKSRQYAKAHPPDPNEKIERVNIIDIINNNVEKANGR